MHSRTIATLFRHLIASYVEISSWELFLCHSVAVAVPQLGRTQERIKGKPQEIIKEFGLKEAKREIDKI